VGLLGSIHLLEPVGRGETVEEGSVPCGTDGLGDLEREAKTVLEVAAVVVGTTVGEG
jgi:hypothetical protein